MPPGPTKPVEGQIISYQIDVPVYDGAGGAVITIAMWRLVLTPFYLPADGMPPFDWRVVGWDWHVGGVPTGGAAFRRFHGQMIPRMRKLAAMYLIQIETTGSFEASYTNTAEFLQILRGIPPMEREVFELLAHAAMLVVEKQFARGERAAKTLDFHPP